MTFDPDKFLAETEPVETEESSFDPDKFLAETEEPVELESIRNELGRTAIDTTAGYLTGKGIQKGSEALQSGLQAGAESGAYQLSGMTRIKEGKRLQELLPEEQFGVKKQAISRKVLDEGLLPGFTESSRDADIRRVKNEKISRSKEVQNYLDGVEKKSKGIKVKDIIKKLEDSAEQDIPRKARITKEGARKLKEVQDEIGRLNKLSESGTKSLSIQEVEDLKKEVTKGSKTYNPDDVSQQLRRKSYKDLVEESVEKVSGKQGLNKFKELKISSGESGLLEDALRQVKAGKGSLEAASDIGRAGIGGQATKASAFGKLLQTVGGPLVKGTDLISKGLKYASPVLRKLPLGLGALGALGTFSEAKAEGLDTKEAALKTTLDTISPIPLPSEKQVAADSKLLRERTEEGFDAIKSGERATNDPKHIIRSSISEGKKIPLKREVVEKYFIGELKDSDSQSLGTLEQKATYTGRVAAANFFKALKEKDARSRTALMFSVMQNPETKKEILHILGVEDENKDEDN